MLAVQMVSHNHFERSYWSYYKDESWLWTIILCLLPVCLWFLLFPGKRRPLAEAWRSTWSRNRGGERALGHFAGLRCNNY